MKHCFASCLLLLLVGTGRTFGQEIPTLEKDILPLFRSRCIECHGGDQPRAGLDLRTRAGMLRGGRHGPGLVPGSIKESLIWLNISTDKMPAKGKKFSDAEKDLLRQWILAGAPGEGVAPTNPLEVRTTASTAPGKQRGVEEAAKLVDEAINARLREAGVRPSPVADDADFLRRTWLDIAGRIPSRKQAIDFLESTDPRKRAKLVDELLAAPEYGKFHAGIWARIITAEEPALKGGLEKWLAGAFNDNRSWDTIVRELIAATGTGPETSFVMSNVDNKVPQPEKLAGSTARLFLGIQLQCAECHNHPFADWKQTDFWGLAAFYSRTQVQKKPKPIGVAEADAPMQKGKSKVKLEGPSIVVPTTAGKAAGEVVAARYLGAEPPTLDEKGPFRPALAQWVTAPENPYFARAAVNRMWAHFFGRGLVNPIDDMHNENPASHPQVLQVLADEFRASGFDRKHLVRCICATQAYQRSTRVTPGQEPDELLYSRMVLRVMSPEAMYDSLVQALGVKELKIQTGYVVTAGRGGQRASATNARDSFIRFFNTRDPDSLSVDYTHGIPQALSLMNDPQFHQGSPIVAELIKADPAPEKVIEGLYLSVLSRRPTAFEKNRLMEYTATHEDPAKAYAGILWILTNTQEFVLIR